MRTYADGTFESRVSLISCRWPLFHNRVEGLALNPQVPHWGTPKKVQSEVKSDVKCVAGDTKCNLRVGGHSDSRIVPWLIRQDSQHAAVVTSFAFDSQPALEEALAEAVIAGRLHATTNPTYYRPHRSQLEGSLILFVLNTIPIGE